MSIKHIRFKDHDEWLSIRHKYLGGSDAGTVMGVNPYASPFSLWAEKTDKVAGFGGNIATQVGHELEDYVARKFTEQTGKKVRRKNFTMVNSDYPWACANVDREIVGENAVLECKTTTNLPNIKKMRNGTEFPEIWLYQVSHYMAVGGYEKGYLAVLISNNDFKVFEIERDDELIADLMEAEKTFWGYVQRNEYPQTDGTKATTTTLGELFPTSTQGETVDLTDLDVEIERYCDINSEIKALEGEKEEIGNIIKLKMKEAEIGENEGYKISYKYSPGRAKFDKKRLQAEHPEIDLSKYESLGNPYRTFKCDRIGG